VAIERALLDRPVGLAVMFGVLALLIASLSLVRARRLAGPPGLRFEEEDPEAIFDGFRLSEGLAARAPAGAPPSRQRL
jgi:hypothetical protein